MRTEIAMPVSRGTGFTIACRHSRGDLAPVYGRSRSGDAVIRDLPARWRLICVMFPRRSGHRDADLRLAVSLGGWPGPEAVPFPVQALLLLAAAVTARARARTRPLR